MARTGRHIKMPNLKWRIVSDHDPVSGIVRFVSRGIVSHVGFLTDDELFEIGARADGGVAVRPINYCNFPVQFHYAAPCTDDQYEKAQNFLHAQVGKPYNFEDILGILVNRDWRENDSWICSELWAATLEQAGLIGKLASSICLFTPQDALILSSAMWPQTWAIS